MIITRVDAISRVGWLVPLLISRNLSNRTVCRDGAFVTHGMHIGWEGGGFIYDSDDGRLMPEGEGCTKGIV